MNPLKTITKELDEYFIPINELYPKAYNKNSTGPYSKLNVILANGTEFESVWFMHQFARHTDNKEILEKLAIIRAQEQQQQKRISCLKPLNESILETTIAYEQLAVELTASLAKREKDKTNKQALDFALLEDFDHLYRFSNMLLIDKGIEAERLVGKYTEIMPGRPTIAEYRYPSDNLSEHMISKKADLFSKLTGCIITAAEQQTMNYYMNIAQWYKNDLGRKLYAEIGMVEEEHVTQYESLKDPNLTQSEKQALSIKMMDIYKKNDIHPFASIITTFISFPIFIAVWAAMNETLAIRKGTLLGMNFGETINTQIFSGNITSIILFVLMIAGQLVTMKLSTWLRIRKEKKKNPQYVKPASNDSEKQMNIMMTVMIFMIVMSGFLLPAALVIYWFLGSVFSIIQTLVFSTDFVNDKLKGFANRKKKAKVVR